MWRRGIALLLVSSLCAQTAPGDRLGGPASIEANGPRAFGYPAPTLTRRERRRFFVGNSFFKQNWVEAPASASARDGLGPLFNARSCSACHFRDGRSAPPAPEERERHGLLLRIGIRNGDDADLPHPKFGKQIQDRAVRGFEPEARTTIRYRTVAGTFADGEAFELLSPTYAIEPAAGGDAVFGPRTAPALLGLGLLEAVPNQALLELADENDRDGDGVSGRVHFLDDARTSIGRFGWKATQATVREQVATAFAEDIGISSTLVPMHDEAPEIGDANFDHVVFYTQTLAVPMQRDAEDAAVRRGQRLFDSFGCASCHLPALTTGENACHPSFVRQTIRPYTDLLLHDLGEGLADDKRDGDAAPSEWRTAPLWGIGLLVVVNGHTRLPHDGRARNVGEAILWHGGEAERAKQRYRTADTDDRAALRAFVLSL